MRCFMRHAAVKLCYRAIGSKCSWTDSVLTISAKPLEHPRRTLAAVVSCQGSQCQDCPFAKKPFVISLDQGIRDVEFVGKAEVSVIQP